MVPILQRSVGRFLSRFRHTDRARVKVVALSVDDEETSTELVSKRKLRFPVGHSADADKVAAVTGAYVNDDPHYLQSPASSWRQTGRFGSLCTQAAPSAGWSPTM